MPGRFDAERWRAAASHLDHALELPVPERAAWLAGLRAQDAAVAADVEALLAEHSALQQERFMESAPASPVATTSLAGQVVGAYTLRAVLGQGGMGSVWLSERSDGRFEGRAAVKLLNASLLGAESEARFRREGSILARLRHPHIAQLIDAGVSSLGQPYLVLELVDGERIDRYCDGARLDVRARLQLFLDVLAAVSHAHANLIVHRDLKPSNVLVTRDGRVKLLDFGIAKLMEGDPAREVTLTVLTRAGESALTPEYAAPEQLTGQDVTTATDVYALGVLLYLLLTGSHPVGPDTSPAALLRAILETEPPHPSDAVTAARAGGGGAEEAAARRASTPRRLSALLKGDLDNIVAKALRKLPADRYASAEALADDLRRHLAQRPVRARADSVAYRTTKFVRRHRRAVAVATLALILLALGVAGTLLQARRARVQAARANSMRDFMFDAFAQAEPGTPQAGPATVVDVVERAIATALADRQADPRSRIELLVRLGDVLNEQGQLPRAQALLASTLASARSELGRDDLLTLDAERALALNTLLRGDLTEARGRLDALLARVPEEAAALRATVLRHSATLATKQRDRQRALREVRRAVDLARLSGDDEVLVAALSDLGNVLLTAGAVAEAARSYEEELALERSRHGDVHARVASAEAALARAYRRSGQLDRAEAHARAAAAIDERVYAGDHWRRALHLNALAMVLRERRRYDEALAAESEALRIRRVTLGDNHADTLSSLNNMGMLLGLREDFGAAVPLLREALDRTEAKFGAEHWDTALSRANYGWVLGHSGRRAEGDAQIDHAIASASALADPDPDLVATCIEKRARVALDTGDPAAALPLAERIAQALAKLDAPDNYWTGRVDALGAEALLALGRAGEAAGRLDAADRALRASPRPEPVLAAEVPLLRASAAQTLGQQERARSLAAEGRARLAGLAYAPRRLTRRAASLPR